MDRNLFIGFMFTEPEKCLQLHMWKINKKLYFTYTTSVFCNILTGQM